MNTPTWAQLVNLAVAVLFILSLKGLSSPKTARLGTGLGALGALIATVVLSIFIPMYSFIGNLS